jgi:hypothetical protein
MEFKVGDKVKVIKNEYTFQTYDTWINKCAMQYKKKWKEEELPNKNNEYIIKVKAPHEDGLDIYLIQDIKTKQVYIIDEKGIELVKENKTFFKKLPNNYTGTIEVENGYIVEKEILDEKEKEYLSAVIRPFKDRIEFIAKRKMFDDYICIGLNDEAISLPYFKKGTMYKGMELYKEYTLKELGLGE